MRAWPQLITPCKSYNLQKAYTVDETLITSHVARDRVLVERCDLIVLRAVFFCDGTELTPPSLSLSLSPGCSSAGKNGSISTGESRSPSWTSLARRSLYVRTLTRVHP
jgi:hypothetical protein